MAGPGREAETLTGHASVSQLPEKQKHFPVHLAFQRIGCRMDGAL